MKLPHTWRPNAITNASSATNMIDSNERATTRLPTLALRAWADRADQVGRRLDQYVSHLDTLEARVDAFCTALNRQREADSQAQRARQHAQSRRKRLDATTAEFGDAQEKVRVLRDNIGVHIAGVEDQDNLPDFTPIIQRTYDRKRHVDGLLTDYKNKRLALHVRWKGTSAANAITIHDGEFGAAVFATETAVIDTLVQHAGLVQMGVVTMGSLTKHGGELIAEDATLSGMLQLHA